MLKLMCYIREHNETAKPIEWKYADPGRRIQAPHVRPFHLVIATSYSGLRCWWAGTNGCEWPLGFWRRPTSSLLGPY